MIQAAAVTIPAHNEEALLPSCLAAVRQATATLRAMPVRTVVVADACTDGTARLAREAGASVVEISARNVGAARAAGMSAALRAMPGLDPARVWLATTDADTLVPSRWLSRQIHCASRGWDAILGTVTVTDWVGRPAALAAVFAAHYRHGAGTHQHVHGANLGVRASAYLAAGGFQALRTGEDHALLESLGSAGCTILPVTDNAVETSARQHARAPRGFSHLLGQLAALPRACRSAAGVWPGAGRAERTARGQRRSEISRVTAASPVPGRALTTARASYGVALVLAPGPVILLATGRLPGRRARQVACLLGARHLLQAALTAAVPLPGVFAAGAAVDALHATSMLMLAAVDRSAQPAALTDALFESLFAGAGFLASPDRRRSA